MRRRTVITLLGGAVVSLQLPARAQQPAKKLPVVGYVAVAAPVAVLAGPDPTQPLARAFVHGLRDLGWVEGHTVVIERRSAEGLPERAPAIVADLIARGVDVFVLANSPLWLVQAVQTATRDIPVVVLFSDDPVAEGLIASLARPGGNLTGVTDTAGYVLIGKRLQLLKEAAPGIVRVAFLGRRQDLEEARSDAAKLGMTGIYAEVERFDQLDGALATILRERPDALHSLRGSVIYVRAPRIAAFAAEHRLPSMFHYREAVEAGGLMSYGTSTSGLFRQMAGYVDRILKGAKPADLAVQRPVRFELVINGRTAKALGLTIPPTLLTLADEVIE